MLDKKNLPDCPVALTLELIGSKWKILIIRDLLKGTKRYSEIKKGLPDISQKVLSTTLKSMVDDGLLIRQSYPEVPPRVEYTLTPMGYSIEPVILEMAKWGNTYRDAL